MRVGLGETFSAPQSHNFIFQAEEEHCARSSRDNDLAWPPQIMAIWEIGSPHTPREPSPTLYNSLLETFYLSSALVSLQNWFKNKRYRLRLKKEPMNNTTTHLIPAPVKYIENIGPQTAYVSVPYGFFYPPCFNPPQSQQEMACLSPPVTSNYYIPWSVLYMTIHAQCWLLILIKKSSSRLNLITVQKKLFLYFLIERSQPRLAGL